MRLRLPKPHMAKLASPIEVLYTDLPFQLPPTLTISFTTQVRGLNSIGYEVCGNAAKDLSKLNEGEVKGSLNIPWSRL